MLRELTKTFPYLWVRVADTDGEFLLIEAANVVPMWLSPEMDQHRVWIHGGKLLIIPSENSSTQNSVPANITLHEAIDFLKTKAASLFHSPSIESEALYRLDKYPGHISKSAHHSLVTIPRKLAYILHTLPKSISPAAEAFYLRDALSLRKILQPSQNVTFMPEDLVTTSVHFSRVLYAQLKSQRFEPPPSWQHLFHEKCESATQSNMARLEMGMKLTCGFEMLVAEAHKHKSRVVRELALVLEDLEEDGAECLPTDEKIMSWPNSQLDNSESWLNINYEDFERELDGGASKGRTAKKGNDSGFGDSQAQTDLRKIVSRFESFLNDDKAGIEGVDLEEMDHDNDSSDDSDLEDKDVSFNEDSFARMVREVLKLPAQETAQRTGQPKERPGSEPDEAREVQELSSQMEAELKGHGALTLDPKTSKQARLTKGTGEGQDGTEDDNEDVNIDYNLAKNLLESFKGQGGEAGPASNLLGMMGFQLPRDEDDPDGDGEQR